MKRFVSIWLADWPIMRLRRADPRAVPDNAPLALVEDGARGLRITAVNARARRDGVRIGQGLADARAAVPALSSRPAEVEADHAALVGLARWCGRYGPQRNCEDGDGIWIDTTGVAHLFGGEERLIADLVGRLKAFGLEARVGVAETPGAAHAVARFAPMRAFQPYAIVGEGTLKTALCDLPVEALRLPGEMAVLLRRLGLKRIGQLHALPRVGLERRFRESKTADNGRRRGGRRVAAGLDEKAAASLLLRLDQVLGRVGDPRAGLDEPAVMCVRQSWADPLMSHEGIEAGVKGLGQDLVNALDEAGLGVRRLRLCLYRSDGSVAEAVAGTSRACRDGSHMLALLADRLGNIDAGFGVDVMSLEAVSAEPIVADQEAFSGAGAGVFPVSGSAGEDGGVARLIDRLANRLGSARVTHPSACDSHMPERAQVMARALDGGFQKRAIRAGGGSGPGGGWACEYRGAGWRRCMPRPLLLFERPEPITVMAEVPEGAPLGFTWRRVAHRVCHAEGPERIAPEWWRHIGEELSPNTSAASLKRPRDYYRVEVGNGARYWVFRAGLFHGHEGCESEGEDTSYPGPFGPPCWFVHGLFG